nr:ribonuclease E inhibitor RraB [Sulfurimonas marina]
MQSRDVLEMLIDEDDDLTIARPVEHYVYFDTPTQRERYVKNLSLEGFEYKDDIDSEDFENGVALVKTHQLLPEVVDEVVETIYESLQKDYGHYEGWSTTLANDLLED